MVFSKRGLCLVLLALVSGCNRSSRCQTVDALSLDHNATVTAYPDCVTRPDLPLAIVGDTQRTSLGECVLFNREVNDDATKGILGDIAQAKPGLLVIVGDMVYQGSSSVHWHWFDALMSPIRQAQIPVLPALGNHDYFGRNAEAHREIALRFPKLAEQSHYALPYGRLGLVWLDSNKGPLGDEAWGHQKDWFAKTLQDFDAKPEIKGVLVFLHHAPFTNSIIVKGDKTDAAVRAELVPIFNDAVKTVAMVTGHAHGYEHFVSGPKHFFVSAGGGGPRGGLHAPEENEPDDIFAKHAEKGTLRPFNYLLVHQDDRGIQVETHGFYRAPGPAPTVLETTPIPFGP